MKKCDVLYIHPTKKMESDTSLRFGIMPMGIIGILNNLEAKGIKVLGYDYAIEKHLDPDFNLSSLLLETDYKILMTDLHWYEHSYGAIYITELSKRIKPNIPTIIGGYTSTIFADEIINSFDSVDYILTGDSDLPSELLVDFLLGKGTKSLSDIPNLLYREGFTAKRSSKSWVQTTLDNIDFVNTDFFEHADSIPFLSTKGVTLSSSERWLCVARGCKYNCSYCCGAMDNMNQLFGRCNIITRSPQKVSRDFYILTSQGIDFIAPSHDFQMLGKDYYTSLFSEIRKMNFKPGLYLECFQLPTKNFIDDIAATFDTKKTVIVISPISGNETLREQNGKRFDNDSFYDIIYHILSLKLCLQVYYTINPFGETRQQYEDTVFQMTYLKNVFKLGSKNVFYQQIVLDPLAGMRNVPGVEPTLNTFKDYYDYCLLPQTEHKYSGFDDNSEVPIQEKKQMYASMFEQK